MSDTWQQRLIDQSEPARFRRTKGLVSATTLGVGAMMGAGLYVLVGIAAAEAGPGLWIAYGACAVLTFLTVLVFADFSRLQPVAGGGYVYVYRQLGSFWGFMVGWHLAVGSIFACGLYATGFASYLGSFLFDTGSAPWLCKGLAAISVVVLTLAGLRASKGAEGLQRLLTWGNLGILLFLAAVSVPLLSPARYTPMLPQGFGGVGAAISLIYISFFGYQLIANNAEEFRDPTRTMPRAMILAMGISTVAYLVVAVVAVGAVDWRELASSDAPLKLLAEEGLGRTGAVVIGAGGILASLAALNSTLSSQGRQIFAMGRDRMLPEQVGTLSDRSRLPVTALLLGALVTICVIVLADITFIAKSANFALLFAMMPISVALHRLYGLRAEKGEAVSPLKRAVPLAALVANAGLLLTLDWQSLLFGGVVVGCGCAVYLTYTKASERRGRSGFSVALSDDDSFIAPLARRARILVSTANPDTQEPLFYISESLMPTNGGEIVVLNVIKTEAEENPREALRRTDETERSIQVLKQVSRIARGENVKLRPVVRAARSLAEGIIDAAVEERCELVVMGWSSRDDGEPSDLLTDVVARLPMDSIFLKLKEKKLPRRIGVAVGARDNLPLMARVAGTMAERNDGEVTYINIVPRGFDREHLRHARQLHTDAIDVHTSLTPCQTEILRADNPLEALIERSKGLDALIIGSMRGTMLGGGELGAFSTMLAQKAHCSVAVVRRSPALAKVLGSQLESIREIGGR